MNEIYNFTPDEKRMQIAALLQEPNYTYQKYKGPLAQPLSLGLDKDALKSIADKFANDKTEPVPAGLEPYPPEKKSSRLELLMKQFKDVFKSKEDYKDSEPSQYRGPDYY